MESNCFALTSIEFLCKVNHQLKIPRRAVFRYRIDSSTKYWFSLRRWKPEQEMPGVLPHSYSESIVPCAWYGWRRIFNHTASTGLASKKLTQIQCRPSSLLVHAFSSVNIIHRTAFLYHTCWAAVTRNKAIELPVFPYIKGWAIFRRALHKRMSHEYWLRAFSHSKLCPELRCNSIEPSFCQPTGTWNCPTKNFYIRSLGEN
jgi:hypothetical protein